MSSDSITTVQTLKDLLKKFRAERDWKKFHDPKNLAEAISIEAAELMELFLWRTIADVEKSMTVRYRFQKGSPRRIGRRYLLQLESCQRS